MRRINYKEGVRASIAGVSLDLWSIATMRRARTNILPHRQRGVGDERQAFAGEVVDDGQNAETSAGGEGIPAF